MKKLFLDANIFFAATCSKSGGSFAIFQMAKLGKLRIFSSRYAVKEAIANVEKKLGSNKVPDLLNLISLLDDLIDDELVEKYFDLEKLINKKDLPILSAAFSLKADFLITLDKKDFKTEKLEAADLPFKINLPGEFLLNCAGEVLNRPL